MANNKRTKTPQDAFKNIPQVVTRMHRTVIEGIVACTLEGNREKEIRILRGGLPVWMNDEIIAGIIDEM